MDQLPHDPADVHDAPTAAGSKSGTRSAAQDRLEHTSLVLLMIGAVMAAILVVLPGVVIALILLQIAGSETWLGGPASSEERMQPLIGALMVVAFVIACEGAVVRSLRQGWIALALVGLLGLPFLYIGGTLWTLSIAEITALSVVPGTMGVALTGGAGLGIAARVRRGRPSSPVDGTLGAAARLRARHASSGTEPHLLPEG